MLSPIDPKKIAKTPIDNLSYEEAFNEFEQIVAALESGEHTLEVSLALFERGQNLAQHCAHLLDQAELKVKQLSGEDIIPFTGGE